MTSHSGNININVYAQNTQNKHQQHISNIHQDSNIKDLTFILHPL